MAKTTTSAEEIHWGTIVVGWHKKVGRNVEGKRAFVER